MMTHIFIVIIKINPDQERQFNNNGANKTRNTSVVNLCVNSRNYGHCANVCTDQTQAEAVAAAEQL
jgi:hypothetical protein